MRPFLSNGLVIYFLSKITMKSADINQQCLGFIFCSIDSKVSPSRKEYWKKRREIDGKEGRKEERKKERKKGRKDRLLRGVCLRYMHTFPKCFEGSLILSSFLWSFLPSFLAFKKDSLFKIFMNAQAIWCVVKKNIIWTNRIVRRNQFTEGIGTQEDNWVNRGNLRN